MSQGRKLVFVAPADSLCLRLSISVSYVRTNPPTRARWCSSMLSGAAGTSHREKKTKKTKKPITFLSARAAQVQPGAERPSVKCAVI